MAIRYLQVNPHSNTTYMFTGDNKVICGHCGAWALRRSSHIESYIDAETAVDCDCCYTAVHKGRKTVGKCRAWSPAGYPHETWD